MKLLYIFLLSFVVGSRRLSGYYNKICSICIINLPPVNSQGVTNHITCLRLTVDRNLADTSSSFMAIVRRLKWKWEICIAG